MAGTNPKYWFAVKRYGWGWGMPVRWQGWAVLLGYLGLLYAGIYGLTPGRGAAVYLLVLTALLVVVVVWKGERPVRWRWDGE